MVFVNQYSFNRIWSLSQWFYIIILNTLVWLLRQIYEKDKCISKVNTHQISNSQMKTQQSVSGGQSGRLDASLNPSLAASAAGSISPSESDLSGCSYSVRHKLHVSYSIIRLFSLIFPISIIRLDVPHLLHFMIVYIHILGAPNATS